MMMIVLDVGSGTTFSVFAFGNAFSIALATSAAVPLLSL